MIWEMLKKKNFDNNKKKKNATRSFKWAFEVYDKL